jgi:hypothetical protein
VRLRKGLSFRAHYEGSQSGTLEEMYRVVRIGLVNLCSVNERLDA